MTLRVRVWAWHVILIGLYQYASLCDGLGRKATDFHCDIACRTFYLPCHNPEEIEVTLVERRKHWAGTSPELNFLNLGYASVDASVIRIAQQFAEHTITI